MSVRTRKKALLYTKYTKKTDKDVCQFCSFTKNQEHIIEESPYFWVVKNIFPYDVWDSSGVSDHLMLIPKRHVDSLAHFKPTEQQEFTHLLGKYEEQGYSVYARAPSNGLKSIAHQHTHLIAVDSKVKRVILFIRKPHLLFTK